MKPEIDYQKKLMESALLTLKQIEYANSEIQKKEFENQYAETMGELAGELLSLRKVNITIHEEIHY